VLLGYVGRFMPEKGFDVLIEAVRRLAGSVEALPPFLIVAINDGAFVREYRERVAQLGLGAYFRFAGFQRSAAGTLTELDAVVVPSRREACPLVAMEAMVLGCPVIASDCIGLREVTAGTPALQCRADDPASLAGAIRRFVGERQAMAQRARGFVQTAREAFDASNAAGRLTVSFERALASHRARRRPVAPEYQPLSRGVHGSDTR
jgi:glycosyltransferase involved in cell wall biosynthesis